jgi:hypothetical protein
MVEPTVCGGGIGMVDPLLELHKTLAGSVDPTSVS